MHKPMNANGMVWKAFVVIRLREKGHRLTSMSEVVPDTHQEFWRPPVVTQTVISLPAAPAPLNAVESCGGCRAEFMPGSRFCYLCGAPRGAQATGKVWSKHLGFLSVLGFQHIKQALGLPIPSLVGLFAGICCVAAALAVGRVLAPQNATDFQTLQLLRIEWLLGSVAAFLAGILLKRSRPGEDGRNGKQD
jgi:hypothetical protein